MELRQINVVVLAINEKVPEDVAIDIQIENSTPPPSVLSSNLAKGVIITFILTAIGFLGIWSFFKGEIKAEPNVTVINDTILNRIPPVKSPVFKPEGTGNDKNKPAVTPQSISTPPIINKPNQNYNDEITRNGNAVKIAVIAARKAESEQEKYKKFTKAIEMLPENKKKEFKDLNYYDFGSQVKYFDSIFTKLNY